MKNDQPKINIIIVDDHRLFRMGLKSAFQSDHPDICVTGEADSSQMLFALPALSTAHLVLLDVNLPGMGGAEIACRLRSEYPAIKILAISGENSAQTIQAMIEAGIDGFISKQHGDTDELADAIRSIMSGLEYFGRDISSIILGTYVAKKKTATVTPEFTDREREIIELCQKGLVCKEIAAHLNISTTTINTHKARIFLKLGINNTMEMVQYAIKHGIIRVMLLVLLFPGIAFAQYSDHRNRRVDSLEQVLATHPPEGNELRLIYENLMWGYMQINIEKSMEYARKFIAANIPCEEWYLVSDGYSVLGMDYYAISQYDSAMICYDKALEATGKMKNFPGKYSEQNIDESFSRVYGSIGNVYNILGKYHEAIEYYTRALKIFEKNDWKESQTVAYYNIGVMYLSMNNYSQAEINLLKSDSLAHIIGASLNTEGGKMNLANLYLRKKEYDKALKNIEIAYNYYFSHPDEEGIDRAMTLSLMSEIYLEGYGDDRRAEEFARQALALSDELDIPREKAISLRVLAAIYLKRGQWRQAEQSALKALDTDDSEPANTLAIYEILSKAYAHLGNAAKAGEYIDKLIELQSTWSNKNYQSSIRDMEVKYETGKKEMEIERQQHIISRQDLQRRLLAGGVSVCVVILALLWFMLRLRTRRNHTLAKMNSTKDKFFSIISHDLKNPA